jgi:ribonuclease P protein component
MRSFRFKKEERILRRVELNQVNLHGRRHYTEHFRVVIKQNRMGGTRLGITVGKRVGNAAKRNRIKRLIREFFRLNKQQLPVGYDILISPIKAADVLTMLRVQEELGDLLIKNEALFL